MTALSAKRDVESKELGGQKWYLAADSQTFYNGALCMEDSAGKLRPAGALAGNKGCVGIVEIEAARSEAAGTPGSLASGTGGDVKLNVREGIFKMVGATLGQDDVGSLVWALDDQTVDETAPAASVGQSPIAGNLVEYIDASSSLVDISWRRPQVGIETTILAASKLLVEIANGDVFTDFIPGFAGILTSISVLVGTAASSASKLTTLGVDVVATATTGGLALTTANCTEGAYLTQALTGGVYFGPSDAITVAATSTTAFVEGSATIIVRGKRLTK